MVYGMPPPIHIPYFLGDSKITAVDQFLQDREATLQIMKHYLTRAQHRMKQQSDKHRTDRTFEIGD